MGHPIQSTGGKGYSPHLIYRWVGSLCTCKLKVDGGWIRKYSVMALKEVVKKKTFPIGVVLESVPFHLFCVEGEAIQAHRL